VRVRREIDNAAGLDDNDIYNGDMEANWRETE